MNMTSKEIEKVQYDILYNAIDENGYLPPSSIEALNKNLNTSNKRIIKAINEVLNKADSARLTIDDFRDRFNSIIGNEIANPDYKTNLIKVGPNLLEATYNLYNKIINMEKLIADIEGVKDVTAITERMKELEAKIDSLDLSKIVLTNVENINYNNIQNNTFTVSKNPISANGVNLIINGITYCGCDGALSVDGPAIKWLFTESNNGFELDSNDSIQAQYNYSPVV